MYVDTCLLANPPHCSNRICAKRVYLNMYISTSYGGGEKYLSSCLLYPVISGKDTHASSTAIHLFYQALSNLIVCLLFLFYCVSDFLTLIGAHFYYTTGPCLSYIHKSVYVSTHIYSSILYVFMCVRISRCHCWGAHINLSSAKSSIFIDPTPSGQMASPASFASVGIVYPVSTLPLLLKPPFAIKHFL